MIELFAVAILSQNSNPFGVLLSEKLRDPAYLNAFNRLFTQEKNLHIWLQDYRKRHVGVQVPCKQVKIGDKSFEYYSVCMPHRCPDFALHVFFTPSGDQAWALFIAENEEDRFFGNPSPEIKSALLNQVVRI